LLFKTLFNIYFKKSTRLVDPYIFSMKATYPAEFW